MELLDERPTNENIFEHFKQNTIYRNEMLFNFIRALNAIDNNCTIALDGKWGSGKTFFVKQAKMILDSYNSYFCEPDEKKMEIIEQQLQKAIGEQNTVAFAPFVTVYFDAWENDNDVDPLLSMIYVIAKTLGSDFNLKAEKKIEIKDFIYAIASSSDKFIWRSVGKMIEMLQSEDLLEKVSQEEDMRIKIKNFLGSLLPEIGDKLVIFIDELDRCSPSYAVRLLERIKHYFENENIIFVLSLNTTELESTVKKHYGEEFDACRYLDRFFDLRMSLPEANIKNYLKSIGYQPQSRYYFDIATVVIEHFNFGLREITRYIRFVRVAITPNQINIEHDNNAPDRREGLVFCLSVLVPYLIGLRMDNSHAYNGIVEGKDFSKLLNFVGSNAIVLETCSETFISAKLKDAKETIEFIEKFCKAMFSVGDKGLYLAENLKIDVAMKNMLMNTISLISNFSTYDY